MRRTFFGGLVVSLVLGGSLASTGCSSSGASADAAVLYPDLTALDFGAACGPDTYPCGPYGTKNGNIAGNEVFQGFMDADNFCKKHIDKKIDTGKLVSIGLVDWFKTPAACAKTRKILWVNVAAGWCGPCRAEVQELRKQVLAGGFNEAVGFLNIIFEDSKYAPATAAFAKTWATSQDLQWPVVADPNFRMGQYFDKAATPFNMLVDTSTMKIFYQGVGADLPGIAQQIDTFLKAN